MHYSIELDREVDGRWIAEIPALPGVMAYGATHEEALSRVMALAFRVLADRLERGEAEAADLVGVTFGVVGGHQVGREWKVAEVIAKAIDVLGGRAEAAKWITEPARGLGGKRPMDLLSTPAGVEAVEALLGRLDRGVYT